MSNLSHTGVLFGAALKDYPKRILVNTIINVFTTDINTECAKFPHSIVHESIIAVYLMYLTFDIAGFLCFELFIFGGLPHKVCCISDCNSH